MVNTVQNGKGDSPRNCFSEKFRKNYDLIFKKNKNKSKKNKGKKNDRIV